MFIFTKNNFFCLAAKGYVKGYLLFKVTKTSQTERSWVKKYKSQKLPFKFSTGISSQMFWLLCVATLSNWNSSFAVFFIKD